MCERPIIIAGRLEPDPNRQAILANNRYQSLEILEAIADCQSTAAWFARNPNQHLMPMLGNIDGYNKGRNGDSVDKGHGRSPLQCGSQNHSRDLKPGFGCLLRNIEGCAGGLTFRNSLLPTVLWHQADTNAILVWQ